jgi:Zn finger protein HypA/HybF involved in hydrogenase expression
MHEFALARALWNTVLETCPRDKALVSVLVHLGPARAIEPELLRSAWCAFTQDDARFCGSRLELSCEPWQLRCRSCGREFDSKDWDVSCACGGKTQLRKLGQDLWIESIEVSPLDPAMLEVKP